MLVPMPDYPLWTAAVNLSGGTAVHYKCDEENYWYPDLADMESKITANTRGIVVINPNNPTGSVYPSHVLEQIVALAKNMILFCLQMKSTTKSFMTALNMLLLQL
jgi:alanine-synthesizing transaminase